MLGDFFPTGDPSARPSCTEIEVCIGNSTAERQEYWKRFLLRYVPKRDPNDWDSGIQDHTTLLEEITLNTKDIIPRLVQWTQEGVKRDSVLQGDVPLFLSSQDAEAFPKQLRLFTEAARAILLKEDK